MSEHKKSGRKWSKVKRRLDPFCLTEGIKSGEFIDVPVQETVNILIALINGLIRQQIRKMDNLNGAKDAAVAFCRRSLLKQ